jgi:hypothetical protein
VLVRCGENGGGVKDGRRDDGPNLIPHIIPQFTLSNKPNIILNTLSIYLLLPYTNSVCKNGQSPWNRTRTHLQQHIHSVSLHAASFPTRRRTSSSRAGSPEASCNGRCRPIKAFFFHATLAPRSSSPICRTIEPAVRRPTPARFFHRRAHVSPPPPSLLVQHHPCSLVCPLLCARFVFTKPRRARFPAARRSNVTGVGRPPRREHSPPV